MRSFVICACAAALVSAPTFAAAASETFEWRGGADAATLEVSHVVGEVSVAVGGEEVVVRATKKGENEGDLAAVTITAEEKGDAVAVGVEYPEDEDRESSVTVDFEISVPESLGRVEVTSAAGEVIVAGVAEAAASTASGRVTISGVYKKVDVSTASGDVAVDNAGEATEFAAVSNVSGRVKLQLELPKVDAGYGISSVSGPIELVLTGRTDNYDISVRTVTGQVESAFPLEKSGGLVGKRYSGRAGAATNKIEIKTVSGSVKISAPDK